MTFSWIEISISARDAAEALRRIETYLVQIYDRHLAEHEYGLARWEDDGGAA